ncbi:MAG: phosphoribosylglycinamide formyltransferase [Epulopiscium sp. Nuni2H_MBin003]|nr:MAG: phosphoribosylglycinamide formyltransferase [Epulopiscium sp. Nuni2H_MBin003]
MRIAVLASGSGSNLQAIIDAKLDVCAVISNKVNAYALTRANNSNIPNYVVDKKGVAGEVEIINILKQYDIELVVLAGYLKILGETILTEYKGRIINIHPSLLPKYGGKGCYGIHVHEQVIANKEAKSGATVHFVEAGIDTGKIILQRMLDVSIDDTPSTLQQKILNQIEHSLLVDSIKLLESEYRL